MNEFCQYYTVYESKTNTNLPIKAFREMDANGDGILTAKEALNGPTRREDYEDAFRELDRSLGGIPDGCCA